MTERVVRVDEVCEAASALSAEYVRAVATDADGTLWEGDVGDALFRHLIARDALDERARGALRALCLRCLRDVPASPDAQAAALIAGHAAGTVPIEALCDLEAEAAGGRPRSEYDALLREVAAVFATRMRPESVALITRLYREGFSVHVVTGSLGALVEATLEAAGVTVSAVSGGRLVELESTVLPTLAEPIPLNEGKVAALRAAGRWPPAVGLGDGGWDANFLGGCAIPLLVHPSQRLVDAMKQHPTVARLSHVPL